MEPKIVDKGQIVLLGVSFFGDPFETSGDWTEENEIGRLWKRFFKLGQQLADIVPKMEDVVAYEVHIYNEETMSKGHFEVFVGVQVDSLAAVPVEAVIKILPPTCYAVFTLQGEQIVSDWTRDIYHGWLAESKYEEAYRYHFQQYDRRFKGLDHLDESVLDVYIPIKEADGGVER